MRYGGLRGNILGLEAVLADGTIIDSLQTLRKDNTGYDIKQQFIGSEGTLGIITKASVLCAPLPTATNVAYLAVETFDQVRAIFAEARANLGEILSAFEFVDEACIQTLSDNLNLHAPIDPSPFALVIETHGSNVEHDQEKLEKFVELVMSNGLVMDGTVADDSAKIAHLWGLRERMAEALQLDGYVYKVRIRRSGHSRGSFLKCPANLGSGL